MEGAVQGTQRGGRAALEGHPGGHSRAPGTPITAGAVTDSGAVRLELDLAEVRDVPEVFRRL